MKAISSDAQSLVVPNNLKNIESREILVTAPFNNPSRYQQVYDAKQFPYNSGPLLISKIAFRPAFSQDSFRRKISDIKFSLSTTKQAVESLNPVFSKNIGINETTIHSGGITFRSVATNRSSVQRNDIVVPLDRPFLYDPREGNLLLDIQDYTGDGVAFLVSATSDPTMRLVYADQNPTTAQSGRIQLGGMITEFTYTFPSKTAR